MSSWQQLWLAAIPPVRAWGGVPLLTAAADGRAATPAPRPPPGRWLRRLGGREGYGGPAHGVCKDRRSPAGADVTATLTPTGGCTPPGRRERGPHTRQARVTGGGAGVAVPRCPTPTRPAPVRKTRSMPRQRDNPLPSRPPRHTGCPDRRPKPQPRDDPPSGSTGRQLHLRQPRNLMHARQGKRPGQPQRRPRRTPQGRTCVLSTGTHTHQDNDHASDGRSSLCPHTPDTP
jgi:hypothetical protein